MNLDECCKVVHVKGKGFELADADGRPLPKQIDISLEQDMDHWGYGLGIATIRLYVDLRSVHDEQEA